MCRPPCCDNSGGQGAGIAAVAIILGAAFIAAKAGPIVARIIHIAVEVIRIAALTAAAVLALAVLAWLMITIARWWLRHRGAQQRMALSAVIAGQGIEQVDDPIGCLACGSTSRVLKAIGGNRYQASSCPVCEPLSRAG
jgi:hypothetical protein